MPQVWQDRPYPEELPVQRRQGGKRQGLVSPGELTDPLAKPRRPDKEDDWLSQGPEKRPRRVATIRLNALGEDLNFFDGSLHRAAADGNPIACRMLLDCGASHTFVSLKTARRLGGRWDKRKSLPVSLPNGETLYTQGTMSLVVRLGDWAGTKTVWAVDVEGYDVVLGNDFLCMHDPYVSFPSKRMWLTDRNGRHEVRAVNCRALSEGDGGTLNLLSKKDVRRALRDKNTEYAVFYATQSEDPLLPVSDDRLAKLLKKFADVFSDDLPKELPPERDFVHHIDTGDANPVNTNAYPLSHEKLEELRKQVKDLLDRGLIQVSSSPWGFPVVFVKKPGGEWRMCIDYRGLNELTAKNGYPIPRIQDLLDIVGQAQYVSKIDLVAGYWQVRMAGDSIQKTAFNTIWGKYEWRAMPFGLCNAPATFQTLMNETLRPYLGKSVVVYLDDILVYSKTLEEHYTHLEQVLECLRAQKLYAKPKKCIFATKELEFCGHVIGDGKVKAITMKLDVIKDWPRPTNVNEVRRFLGLAIYYRRFVKDFAKIAVALHDLTKEADAELRKRKFRPIIWTEQCEVAFRRLKEALVSAPVLVQPDRAKPFTIETDASEWAIGFVLCQVGEDGKMHPVAFDGRKLKGAELNYPVHEKELLAIKEALRTWDRYLENGTRTTIITDHEGLQYLTTTRTYSKRLARWIDEFQAYDLELRYRKGEEAVVPDAISRRPDFIGEGPANVAQQVPAWGRLNMMTKVGGFEEAEWYSATIQYLSAGSLPDDKMLRKEVMRWAGKLAIHESPMPTAATQEENTRLRFLHGDGSTAPYLEQPFRRDFLKKIHEEYGHLGHPGLRGVLRNRAWWPGIRQDTEETVHLCPNCQVSKARNENFEREAAHYLASAGTKPFERWGIDLIGLLPTTPSGNRWIITAIDYATGWPLAKALPEATEEAIAEFLHDDIFTVYGAPAEFLTDNGANLLATSVEYFIKLINAKHKTTTPYHPRTNGKVENFNGLLGRMLTKYCMGKPTRVWDLYLPQALFATRVREHATSGKSPFYLVYGTHPRLPGDKEPTTSLRDSAELDSKIMAVNHARAEANEALLYKAIRAQKIHDERVTTSSLTPGKWVLVRNEAKQKFESQWFGPYKILKAHPLGTYALAEPGGRVLRNLVNGRRLVDAFVENPNQLWTSSGGKYQLRRQGMDIRHPLDGGEIVDTDSERPPSYHELATISRAEWDAMERSGVRSRLVGREEVLRHIAAKARKQPPPPKKLSETVPAPEAEDRAHAPDQGKPQTDFTPTQQVGGAIPAPNHGAEETSGPPREGPDTLQGEAGRPPGKKEQEDLCQDDAGQGHTDPAQGEADEVMDIDLDNDKVHGEGGQGDQHMEDAPQAQQASPYLFRRPRRYATDSQ